VTAFTVGAVVGRYRVVRKLGQGGMGAVFEATCVQTGQAVALKVLLSEEGVGGQRFEREARAALAVKHPNVAATIGSFHESGRLVLVVELLRGGTLKELVRARGRLGWHRAAELGAGIARGLAAVHELGFVHRDLKPENVLLDDAGSPKISDFGLVRRAPGVAVSQALTKTGEVLGTIAYMAPEQLDGKHVDARADLYSLGATIYDLIAGEPPFTGDSMVLVKKILVDRPRPLRDHEPSVPAELDRLVLSLLAKEPAQRPATGQSVANQLEALTRGTGVAEPRRGRPWVVASALVVLAALVGGVALAVRGERPLPATPPVAPAPPVVPRSDPREAALVARYEKLGRGSHLALERVLGQDAPGHAGQVRALAFAMREGKPVLYSGGKDGGDGFVRGWDPASEREVFSFPIPGREVRSLSISSDGTRAVVGTRHDLVFCLDLRGDGATLGKDRMDYFDVAVGISHDGKTAALAGGRQTLQVFDVASGDPPAVSLPLGVNPWFLKFGSDDGVLFAGLDDGRLLRVDVRRRSARPDALQVSKRPINEGAVKAGLIFAAGRGREVYVIDEATFEALSHFEVQTADCGEVYGVDATSDGSRVVTGGTDGYVEVHEVATEKTLLSLRAHARDVTAVALSPDEKTIATAAEDGVVRFLDARTGRETLWTEPPRAHRGSIQSVAVSADGTRVLTAGDDGAVKLWNAESGKIEASFQRHERGAVAAAFAGKDQVLSLGRRGELLLWSPTRPGVSSAQAEGGLTPSLAVSPDGGHAIVLSDWRKPASFFAIASDGLRRLHTNPAPALAAAFSADSAMYATSAGSGTRVNTSYVESGAVVGDNIAPAGAGSIPALAFLPVPSNDLVTASVDDRFLKRWTLGNDRAWAPAWTQPLGKRNPVAIATSKRRIAVAIDDGSVELRDAEDGAVVDSVRLDVAEDRPFSLAFDPAGKRLWVGTGRGALLRFAVERP
jgi:WD40 repeat protein